MYRYKPLGQTAWNSVILIRRSSANDGLCSPTLLALASLAHPPSRVFLRESADAIGLSSLGQGVEKKK